MHLHSSIFNTPQRGEILVGATRQAIQRLVLGLLPELRSCEGVLREDLWQQMRTSLPPDCAAIFITPVGWAARRLVKEWAGEARRAWTTKPEPFQAHGSFTCRHERLVLRRLARTL